MKARLLLFALIVGLGFSSSASAAFIETPLPTNAYITLNGFDWAWAYPLPATANGFDLSYQSQFGWRIPTADELMLAPLATQFLFAGANVPFNGVDPVSGAMFQATNADYESRQSAGAVATPYFSTVYHHADWQDGLGQTFGPWAGMPGAESFADQLVIRAHAGTVPEPATWGMMAIGAATVTFLSRRRRPA